MEFKKKDLLDIKSLTKEEILYILETARGFLDIPARTVKKVPALKGMTVINCFYEPSTRTRTSFELAAKRLSADTINFSSGGSSVEKGETLLDTALNLQAMAPDCIILRHPLSGAPHFLSKKVNCSVVNAGDGTHEHPTQALLDAFTILEKKGRFEGLNVAIIGDILHSRVARSNIYCLGKLGARVRICGPQTLIPQYIENLNVKVFNNIEKAIDGADVVMVLRIQKERIHGSAFPSVREYFEFFGLSLEKLKKAKKDVIVMHPGPMNRGVEISTDVADGEYSVILDQVSNGMAVRMAVFYLLLVGRKKSEETT
ncbi:MAG: aspartate carbamoyltransferase catalytic subunit [Thermoanaerobaculia bacterium]